VAAVERVVSGSMSPSSSASRIDAVDVNAAPVVAAAGVHLGESDPGPAKCVDHSARNDAGHKDC